MSPMTRRGTRGAVLRLLSLAWLLAPARRREEARVRGWTTLCERVNARPVMDGRVRPNRRAQPAASAPQAPAARRRLLTRPSPAAPRVWPTPFDSVDKWSR
jgi:hypothetical protein